LRSLEVIEAELKARVRDLGQLQGQLDTLAAREICTYSDTYYDWPGRQLSAGGRELRLRLVMADGRPRSLLTYKEPAVDSASGSKPEHETAVADAPVIDVMLRALGLAPMVAFEKHCTNYRFEARGREMLATLVRVPELNGTFIEIETMTDESAMKTALADVRAIFAELGVPEDDLTAEQYTDAVMKARA
jgi:adenylate cyclase class 2